MIVKVTFADSEMAAIDAARGMVPRSTWIRAAAVGLAGGRQSPAAEIVDDARHSDVDLSLGSEVEPQKQIRSPKPPKEIPLPKIAKRHWA